MKRDINLLPSKNFGPKKTGSAVVALAVILVYVLVFGIGILIPKNIKEAKTILIKGLDNQITQLEPLVQEYETLKEQLDILQVSINSTGSLDYSKYNAEDALDIIESTCPSGVMIKRLSNNNGTLNMEIVAANNYLISQFALELERSKYFTSVFISGSSPAGIEIDENEQTQVTDAVRATLVLEYDLSIPEEETADAEGTEGGGE
ncbi:MAG: PilN domain-containing protein [Clostridia bacterium]|nr:PilN domain-containing protein [Clostridia bacterium]